MIVLYLVYSGTWCPVLVHLRPNNSRLNYQFNCPSRYFFGTVKSVKYHIRLLHVTCYMKSSCVWVKKPGTLGTLKQLGIMDVYSVHSPSHISHIVSYSHRLIHPQFISSFPSCRQVAQLHRTDLALQILTFGRSAEEQQQQHHHHKPLTICIHKHR